MQIKTELINILRKIESADVDSPLHEICRWCGWYQKLETKRLFGSHFKKPYKICPVCGCPTTIIPDEIVYACALCRRILVEKFVIFFDGFKNVSSVDYEYECFICGNTRKITALHLCGDGELGECDALIIAGEDKPVGFECIRCRKFVLNTKI